ncbi:hypothetical protein T10_4634 [Trichinella papuae]|uniref:Retrovirus-related Pol polyprotein from transposon n=1 Tax=Trichinella papuae TaxID=268474 RepID=A0A0V1MP09_9BILA|nr:hypothetical protein T10_4634 [Trichinella papuae]
MSPTLATYVKKFSLSEFFQTCRSSMRTKTPKKLVRQAHHNLKFEPGDRAWLQVPRSSKLVLNWEGPYRDHID